MVNAPVEQLIALVNEIDLWRGWYPEVMAARSLEQVSATEQVRRRPVYCPELSHPHSPSDLFFITMIRFLGHCIAGIDYLLSVSSALPLQLQSPTTVSSLNYCVILCSPGVPCAL